MPLKTILKNILNPFGIASVFVAIAIPLFIYAAPHFGMRSLISNLDLNAPFWIYAAQFVLGTVLAIGFVRNFIISGGKPLEIVWQCKSELIPLSIIACLALFVCISWIAPRHRVQSDESIFFATAQNLYSNQTAGSCDEGEFAKNGHLDCKKNAHNFKTKGEPFLYALGIPIFGNDLRWTFTAHLFLLAATIFLLYFAVRAWTGNRELAFLTAAIFAAQPTTLFQFRSASVEPLYAFMLALCMLLWKWAWDKNTLKHWIFFGLAIAFFAQTRQETVFCLGAFIAFSFYRIVISPNSKPPAQNLSSAATQGSEQDSTRKRINVFLTFLLTISVFCIPVLLTISHYQGYGFQGGEFSAHGHFFGNLRQAWNITVNTPLEKGLLKNPFLSSFSILTIIGIIILIILAAWEKNPPRLNSVSATPSPKGTPLKNPTSYRSMLLFFILYFPQIFMVLENVSGDLSIEINQRYTLIAFPAMAFFSAFAIERASRLFPKDNQKLFIFIAAAALWGNTLRYQESFEKNIMYNRNHLTTEESEILKWLDEEEIKHPDKNRLFIYSRPWHFIGIGKDAIHYSSINPQKLSEYLKKYDGEVYYVRGLDCWDSQTYHKKAVERRIANVCDNFEKIFPVEPEHVSIITNNYRLIIAKMKEGSGANALFSPKTVAVKLPENAKFLGVPNESRQDWGTLQINKSVTGRPLTIAKKRYANGIGLHANGMMKYNLDGKYNRLTAILGLDEDEFCSNGARIKIFGDGNLLADTRELRPNTEFPIDVSLSKVNELLFTVDALGDIGCDHIDIAIPILYGELSDEK